MGLSLSAYILRARDLRKLLMISKVGDMNITVTGHKGGVGKTVTAVHLATFLSLRTGEGSTVLVDGDPNKSALDWAGSGNLPFDVTVPRDAAGLMRDREHVVLDTQGRPSQEVLEGLVRQCDVLVIPTTPDPLAIKALMLMVRDLQRIESAVDYRVLLTNIPPWPSRSGAKARAAFKARGIPMFEGQIRRRAAFERAALAGVPVYEVKDKRAQEGWEDYETVGEELLG